MALADTLRDALISEANETAARIIQDARKTVENTLNEQKRKGRERAKDRVILIEKKAENDAVIVKLREIASIESKANWLILEKKHSMIENVLNQVKDKLRDLVKTDEYTTILESLIVEAGNIIGVSDFEIILNKQDSIAPLDLKKLEQITTEKTGMNTNIAISTRNIDTIGGALIQTKDKKIVMDNTFEGILKINNDDIRFKIAKILFT